MKANTKRNNLLSTLACSKDSHSRTDILLRKYIVLYNSVTECLQRIVSNLFLSTVSVDQQIHMLIIQLSLTKLIRRCVCCIESFQPYRPKWEKNNYFKLPLITFFPRQSNNKHTNVRISFQVYLFIYFIFLLST